MPQVALIAGAVASVAGTVISVRQQRKAAKLQQQQQTLAARRDRVRAVRQAQIARAQATASAAGSGSLASSGVAGGVGSISSKLGAELGFSTQMSALSRDITRAEGKARMGSGIAELGGLAMSWGASRRSESSSQGIPDFLPKWARAD